MVILGPGIINAVLLLALAVLNGLNQKHLPPQTTVQEPRINNQAKNENLVTSMAIFVLFVIFVCSIVLPTALFNLRLVENQPMLVGFYTLGAYFVLGVIYPALFYIFHKNAVKHVVTSLF